EVVDRPPAGGCHPNRVPLSTRTLPVLVRSRHTPLDSPCLCESNAANHASIGWELVEPLCNMGPGLDGSSLLEGSQPPLIRTGHTLLDSPGRCKSNGASHLLIR